MAFRKWTDCGRIKEVKQYEKKNYPVSDSAVLYGNVSDCLFHTNGRGGCPDKKAQNTEAANQETSGDTAQENSEEEADETEKETGTYPDGSTPEFSGERLRLTVNGTDEVIIAMYDNSAVDAFMERLPLEDLSFFDLSGIEKPIDRPDEPFSLEEEEPGYDPVEGEMVIYRPWGNFTIFYGDFRYSDELVPLGKVESGLDVIAEQTDDFTGELEIIE